MRERLLIAAALVLGMTVPGAAQEQPAMEQDQPPAAESGATTLTTAVGDPMATAPIAVAPRRQVILNTHDMTLQAPEGARFASGLGTVQVDLNRLPAGPFVAQDEQGRQIGTAWVMALDDLNNWQRFGRLPVDPLAIGHMDMYYHAGLPGPEEARYLVVLWDVGPTLAQQIDARTVEPAAGEPAANPQPAAEPAS